VVCAVIILMRTLLGNLWSSHWVDCFTFRNRCRYL